MNKKWKLIPIFVWFIVENFVLQRPGNNTTFFINVNAQPDCFIFCVMKSVAGYKDDYVKFRSIYFWCLGWYFVYSKAHRVGAIFHFPAMVLMTFLGKIIAAVSPSPHLYSLIASSILPSHFYMVYFKARELIIYFRISPKYRRVDTFSHYLPITNSNYPIVEIPKYSKRLGCSIREICTFHFILQRGSSMNFFFLPSVIFATITYFYMS